MSDEVKTELKENKALEDEFSNIINENKRRLERLEEKKDLTASEIMKSTEWKEMEEKQQKRFDEIDEQIKKNNMQAHNSTEKGQAVKNYIKTLQYSVLLDAKNRGERILTDLEAFKPTEDELKSVYMANKETKALDTRVDTRAGYLLMPGDFIMDIINQSAHEYSPIRPNATVKQLAGNQLLQPSKTARGVASWVAQAGTRSKDETVSYGMEKIDLHMMNCYYDTTIEMLDDAGLNLESELKSEYGEAKNVLEGTAFVSGSGIGEPEGILTNADVSETNSGVADEVTVAGLKNIQTALKEPYWNGAKWFMRRATFGTISLLQDGVGAYVFPDNFYSSVKTLLGHEIVFTADMPAIGAGLYPVVWGNMKKAYTVVDKNVSVGMIKDIYSSKATGIIEFLAQFRTGGQVVLPEAIRKLKISA